jgi:hypothetical protein
VFVAQAIDLDGPVLRFVVVRQVNFKLLHTAPPKPGMTATLCDARSSLLSLSRLPFANVFWIRADKCKDEQYSNVKAEYNPNKRESHIN